MNEKSFRLPWWAIVVPLLACGALAGAWGRSLDAPLIAATGVALIAAVLVAVYHAEVIAHRVGEPFGSLILAIAVTVIEVSLIVSLKLSGGEEAAALARDTVYAAVMIICNGIVGACLLTGALRHHTVSFRVEGSSPVLSTLIALTTLTLVLPQFTTTTPGPTYATSQLVFAGLVSLLLYGVFVFVQTVRHREFFLPLDGGTDEGPAQRPGNAVTAASLLLLLAALVAVIGLAKSLSPAIEAAVAAAGAPAAFVGVVIAATVLLPETGAALRAAYRNRMQTSLNLALGSALATIGLTIPAVALLSILIDMPLILGLPAKEMVLLFLTFIVSVITLASGRATVLHGSVHLVLFAAFVYLSIVP